MRGHFLLAIDQGTSSSRAILYDHSAIAVAKAQQEFAQIFPAPGWVEHDPEAIWRSVCEVIGRVLAESEARAADITAIGITNQRETTVLWDRRTGEPIHNAIVWQDRRTAAQCDALRERGVAPLVAARTGLALDPYFSATKIGWLLDNVAGARQRAKAGELAFGTIDSWLLWRLTDGHVHATDATNASRTMLFDIRRQVWDGELLELFGVPPALLPDVRDSACDFGTATAGIFDRAVPIGGIAGDQQAALLGQAGRSPGMTKSTYGTGCFVIVNTGGELRQSSNQLLTTVASRLGGCVSYGLEGSVFVAGSAIQWLRDELGLLQTAAESERIARQRGIVDDVYVVPAFTGLGAPYWDARARGAILGLTRGSSREDIVTATLQSVAFQTRDLIDAMAADGVRPSVIRVDGGMAANDWFLSFLADVLAIPVERPVNVESTIFGAACLAALQSGVIGSVAEVDDLWQRDSLFEPRMADDQRAALLAGWRSAVARVRSAG